MGDLVTEWVGQAQFDPQLMGYIEGAPPVPSENLTDKPDGYAAASSVPGFDADTYKQRNTVERRINKPKQWHGLAACTDSALTSWRPHPALQCPVAGLTSTLLDAAPEVETQSVRPDPELGVDRENRGGDLRADGGVATPLAP
ncbi:hypothetical protein [Streptomyces sp. AM6-12]|uniref:hypothetical protein n=1 Tax=Streptomyces sp. AM6-12 TaxID=3345149 RepID=UPI003789CC8D